MDTVTYLEDRRLMFGARLSASIFNTLSLAVCRFMAQEGYPHVKKVVPPTTCLTFMGIEFDTVAFVVMNKRSVSK